MFQVFLDDCKCSYTLRRQRALYNLGLTGIPINNVNNNCSTGSAALYLAASWVRGAQVDCALALGFERMAPGSLGTNWKDRAPPMLPLNMMTEMTEETLGANHGPGAPRMFSNAGKEYMVKYGASIDHFAKIGKRLMAYPNLQIVLTPIQQRKIINTQRITLTLSLEMAGRPNKCWLPRRSRTS